eukprot:10295998-Karenia_brevis.AAC.1
MKEYLGQVTPHGDGHEPAEHATPGLSLLQQAIGKVQKSNDKDAGEARVLPILRAVNGERSRTLKDAGDSQK